MAYLFVDTSHLLHVGVLDKDFKWLKSEVVETRKTSEILHEIIRSILEECRIEIPKLQGLITIAGPGSYTGMRVGEGLAQVFELDGINVYSFYSSDIPQILGDNSSQWVFPAFKKEYYIRTSDGEMLLSEDDFEQKFSGSDDNSSLYTHGVNELSAICGANTRELLISRPGDIFPHVIEQGMRKRPYYFRPLDVEFKKS